MKVVFIAAPMWAETAEERAENLYIAKAWVIWAFEQGYAPECSWITMVSIIEETPNNRTRGLVIDNKLIERCDEFWLVGSHISHGMVQGRDHCKIANIPVVDLTMPNKWPPGHPKT
ncbi:MAG TPA: hypothetical protein VIE65_15320 [Methylobacter sp.]|jgi:hypothetical protein